MADLSDFRVKLEKSPRARARFIAGFVDLLEQEGVDVDDPKILESLNLNFDLRNGREFVDGTLASSNVVTIVN